MQPNIDSRKLFYFATIVELGSLKKAAKQLSISQPALSMSMTRLERAVGTKLLERSPTGVIPTESGELLCRHAQLIKEEMRYVEARLKGGHTDVALSASEDRPDAEALKEWPRRTIVGHPLDESA